MADIVNLLNCARSPISYTTQHYFKPLTVFISIVFMPCSINTRQANTVDLEIG